MAFIELNRAKLTKNYLFLNQLFKEHHKEWAVVSKMFCGNQLFIQELIKLGAKEICDSRVSNLKVIKNIDPTVQTVYIKPPAKQSIKNIVQYADASFNTEFDTIKMLSDEAKRQNKTHKVIIMIELGDLREGVMGDNLVDFYKSVFELPNIKVTGIGTNLNCLNGVLPSQDKLIIMGLYQQLIEATFKRKIPWVTGGTSVIIPLLMHKQVPAAVNHFRIGETLYFGSNIIEDNTFEGMERDVLKLYAEIIEITEKPKVPIGTLAENPSGELHEINEADYGENMQRAIIDVGLLDISTEFLIPIDQDITLVGASSDMLVLDLDTTKKQYKVGDLIGFNLKYMGALGLLNSNYIEKRVV